MPLLTVPESQSFCRSFTATVRAPNDSVEGQLSGSRVGVVARAGTPASNALKDCHLREIDRLLFFSAVQYRRALDLFTTTSAAWAHVSLYYSCYFAARSLLGMLGSAYLKKKKALIFLSNQQGGFDAEIAQFPLTTNGPHREFWEYYYLQIPPISAWLGPKDGFATQPVNNDTSWLIERRNDVNYLPHDYFSTLVSFQTTFRKTRVVATLPGALNTQFQVATTMLRVAGTMARRLKLKTDALDQLKPAGGRSIKVEYHLIHRPLPNMARLAGRRLLGA